MFEWRFHILIFATNSSGKYQNKEKPLFKTSEKTQTIHPQNI